MLISKSFNDVWPWVFTTHKKKTLCSLQASEYLVYLALHRKTPCLPSLWVFVGTSWGTLESGNAWPCPVSLKVNLDFNINLWDVPNWPVTSTYAHKEHTQYNWGQQNDSGGKDICCQACLTTWVSSLGSTWLKEKMDSGKLSSDFQTYMTSPLHY